MSDLILFGDQKCRIQACWVTQRFPVGSSIAGMKYLGDSVIFTPVTLRMASK